MAEDAFSGDNNTDYTDWMKQIDGSGYRLTGPRKVIIQIMAGSLYALSPIDVYDLGRKDYPSLGLVTVYRTLEKLEELGLIQRVHLPGGCNTYIRATQGHQHLLLCTGCGKAVYFTGDNINPLILSLSNDSGYEISDHWLQLFGLCSDCKN